ncbi:hypothetical protein F4678DRAFT_455604 [Xylaria arbuscula]|nr:hypothetical protein F4678DRAFT_455604 [Xylaria arbuscula]
MLTHVTSNRISEVRAFSIAYECKMSSNHAMSDQITASDMMAVTKINWEKLAAKAGFKDGATAKAHYEPLLNTDRPGDAARKRQNLYGTEAAQECVKTELSDIRSATKSERVKTDTYYCSSDLEDGEV